MAIVMMVFGVLMVIGGISCIAAPVATFSALGWLAGIAILMAGLSSILQYAAGHEGRSVWELLGGICGILFGGFLLVNLFAQITTNVILAYTAAIWLVLRGIGSIIGAFQMRKLNRAMPDEVRSPVWLVLLLFGVLTVLMGGACVMQPILSMISVGWLMGISIVTYGIEVLVLAIQSLRRK